MRPVGFDIETTGLDPETDEIRSIAFYGEGIEAFFYGAEDDVLIGADDFVRQSLHRSQHLLVSWNGEGFDIPFLEAASLRTGGSPRGLYSFANGKRSKYDTERVDGVWWGVRHFDIALQYGAVAEALGVKWSLKPVAEALGLVTLAVDFEGGTTVDDLEPEVLREYNLSDARLTYELAGGAR